MSYRPADPEGRVGIEFDVTTRQTIVGRPEEPEVAQLLAYLLSRNAETAGEKSRAIALVSEHYGTGSATASPEIVAALSATLRKDPNPGVRKKAADALASFAITPEIRTVFLEALVSDKNPAVRLVAVDALAASAKQSPDQRDDRVAAREGRGPAGERLRPRQGGIGVEGHLLLRRDRIETLMTTERLPHTMNTLKFDRSRAAGADSDESPTARADRLAVWILLALGLFLMLVSTGKAEQGSATRTDRFNGTLTAGQTLSVENISGDVVASPGSAFSAVVTVTVIAPGAEAGRRPAARHAHRSEPGRRGLVARDALARNAREPRQAAPTARAAASSRATSSRCRRESTWPCRPSTATSRSATSTAR